MEVVKMQKRFTGKIVGVFLIAALILGSTAALGGAMAAAQTAADKEVVNSTIEDWGKIDYELPHAEVSYSDYQGPSTVELMPIDLTLTKADVPLLMDKLTVSDYLAIYLDSEVYLRFTKNAEIQVSVDNGATWTEYDADNVAAEDFAVWLLQNDPIPGYSMREMQARLENGAEVKHLPFEEGKEMYFVIDSNGVQIELVQREKVASVLVDGQRMMITSAQIPYIISEDMLNSFYDLLVSSGVLAEAEVEQVIAEIMPWIEDNDSFVIIP